MSFSLAIEGTGSLQSTLLISVWISGLHWSEFIVLSAKKKKKLTHAPNICIFIIIVYVVLY